MSRERRWGPRGPSDWVAPDSGELTVEPEPVLEPEPDDDDALELEGEPGAEGSRYIPRYVAT